MVSRMNSSYLLMDVGGTFLKGFVADGEGRLIDGSQFSVPMHSEGSCDEILGSLVTAVTRGACFSAERGLSVAGVGVDFPGPFDYAKGMSYMTHKFQSIFGLDLIEVFSSHPAILKGTPVRFMHDVNAALLGEMYCGNARGYRNAALVTLGTGLGFACCLDGNLQTNEFGSPRISIFRTPFREGILEDYVSKRGITRLYRENSGDSDSEITVKEIAEKAFSGDEHSKRAFEEAGRILGECIAPIIAENNIECLLFGGQISKSFGLFAPSLRETLKDLQCLRCIEPAKHLTEAPFYGLLSALH